ncbi:MAG TPA: 4Fe-4S binding protein [Mobilitalea sp.]|nr:4Fe-4S binding protein [Mobilitalea sp.]
MVRTMININEELCNGCGLCVNACHESAIGLVDGKAKLLRDDYCDGLGNCLPVCPTGAITFVEREALAYNEEEVKRNIQSKEAQKTDNNTKEEVPHHGGCPGSRMQAIDRTVTEEPVKTEEQRTVTSQLRQWPVQIQLVPSNAPYFSGADLLIAADCTAYSYGDFHKFMKNKITLIGCPKLDDTDYSEKFTDILRNNDLNSITVIRMEVPCCGGIVHAVQTALKNSGKMIPWRVVTISTDGLILEDRG